MTRTLHQLIQDNYITAGRIQPEVVGQTLMVETITSGGTAASALAQIADSMMRCPTITARTANGEVQVPVEQADYLRIVGGAAKYLATAIDSLAAAGFRFTVREPK